MGFLRFIQGESKACALNVCKSKRPLVKTPPSQNVPKLVKTSPNMKKRLVKMSPNMKKKIGQNVPIFQSRFSEEIWDSNKEKNVLVSGTDV